MCFYCKVTAHCKVERRKTWYTVPPSLWFKKSIHKPQVWTLKIMPLNEIVRSWIRLLHRCQFEGLSSGSKQLWCGLGSVIPFSYLFWQSWHFLWSSYGCLGKGRGEFQQEKITVNELPCGCLAVDPREELGWPLHDGGVHYCRLMRISWYQPAQPSGNPFMMAGSTTAASSVSADISLRNPQVTACRVPAATDAFG